MVVMRDSHRPARLDAPLHHPRRGRNCDRHATRSRRSPWRLDRARRTASPNWMTFLIWDVFSYSRDRLENADRVLALMPAGPQMAVSLALRSYLRNTLIIERLVDDPKACRTRPTNSAPARASWRRPTRWCWRWPR